MLVPLFLVDKVTIGTCNLASIILNFIETPALDKTQSNLIEDALI